MDRHNIPRSIRTFFNAQSFRIYVALLLGACAQCSQAWSSKAIPLFEPVHQMAIDIILQNSLSADDLTVLKDQQVIVDQDQKAPESYEHAMTGVSEGESYSSSQKSKFIQSSERFIRAHLSEAIDAQKTGNHRIAMEALGKALHPLEDATSPVHAPFKAWYFNETLWDIYAHIKAERIYPQDSDKATHAYKQQLEGTVRWAYAIFLGNAPLPVHFFNADGVLQIPPGFVQ